VNIQRRIIFKYQPRTDTKRCGALCLAASALAIEDTADVKAAKASFQAAFAAAEAGQHAALAPVPVASAYLADDAAVAAAKAEFAAAYTAAEAGEHAALAPKPVEALPVPEAVAPAVVPGYAAAPFYNGYYGGLGYNGYYPYGAAGYAGAGYLPYAYGAGAYPYAAYAPYTYPFVAAAAPKEQ